MTLTIDDILDHSAGSNVLMTPECGTCGRSLTEVAPGIFSHEARVGDWDPLQKERQKRERQIRVDALVAYTGAIEQCQADVLIDPRGFIHSRCSRNARWVVRERERDFRGLTHMAVCTQHGKSQSPSRFIRMSQFSTVYADPADEPIEKEFIDAAE